MFRNLKLLVNQTNLNKVKQNVEIALTFHIINNVFLALNL